MTVIQSKVPGKLVLTGDYAVLFGAPALVLAVNRYANTTLEVTDSGGWVIESNINSTEQYQSLDALLSATQEQPLIHTLVGSLENQHDLPNHARLSLDTTQFYLNGNKLGIGSSAAILVSLAEVLTHFAQKCFTDAALIQLHNKLQNSEGSGLDIATCRRGGLVRFQSGEAEEISMPNDLYLTFVFTNESAVTGNMIRTFRNIMAQTPESTISSWRTLAEEASESVHNTSKFLENLVKLNEFVVSFDRANELGIYSPAHLIAHHAAEKADVVYKPCGAGGGDIGVAMSQDMRALSRFKQIIEHKPLTLIDLEIAQRGSNIEL